jgi:hypothetical protein
VAMSVKPNPKTKILFPAPVITPKSYIAATHSDIPAKKKETAFKAVSEDE